MIGGEPVGIPDVDTKALSPKERWNKTPVVEAPKAQQPVESSGAALSPRERWQQQHGGEVAQDERKTSLTTPEASEKFRQFEGDVRFVVEKTTARPAAHFATDDFDTAATAEQQALADKVYQARIESRTRDLLSGQSFVETEVIAHLEKKLGRKINRGESEDRRLIFNTGNEFRQLQTDYRDVKGLKVES